jgi:hypothetical protein
VTGASRVFLLLAALASLPTARSALASPTRVALMRPSTASPEVTQALTRIEGELTADGFEVVLVDSARVDPAAPIGDLGRDAGALASIDLLVDTAARTAELRVVDRLTNKAVVRRTPIDETDTSKAAEILAVRAVELLRASLLELLIEAGDGPRAAPRASEAEARQASKWASRALSSERPSRWALEAGAAVVASVGGIGPAVLSVLRGRFAFARALTLRATLAGLGTQPRIEAPTGSAVIGQDMGLIELVAAPWSASPPPRLRPAFSLGIGTLYTSVDGQAGFPYVGRRDSQWALAADAGLGLVLQMSQRFAVALEVHALLARPYPIVRFLDDEAAHGGEPSTLATLTLVGSP